MRGGNRIYGLHVIMHNGIKSLTIFENFVHGPRTRTCKLVLEDKDFPRGQQHWSRVALLENLQ